MMDGERMAGFGLFLLMAGFCLGDGAFYTSHNSFQLVAETDGGETVCVTIEANIPTISIILKTPIDQPHIFLIALFTVCMDWLPITVAFSHGSTSRAALMNIPAARTGSSQRP